MGETSALWLFVLLGFLGAAVLHPTIYLWGLAHSAAFPSVVVLTALAWGVLSRAPRKWAGPVLVGMALEFLAMFWSHRWLAVHEPRVLDPNLSNPGYREGGN